MKWKKHKTKGKEQIIEWKEPIIEWKEHMTKWKKRTTKWKKNASKECITKWKECITEWKEHIETIAERIGFAQMAVSKFHPSRLVVWYVSHNRTKFILFVYIKDNWYDSYSEYLKNCVQIADTAYCVKVTHGNKLPFVQLFASEKTHARTHNTLVTITIRCFWYFSNLLFLLKRSSPNFASNIWRSFRQINFITPEIIRNVWK